MRRMSPCLWNNTREDMLVRANFPGNPNLVLLRRAQSKYAQSYTTVAGPKTRAPLLPTRSRFRTVFFVRSRLGAAPPPLVHSQVISLRTYLSLLAAIVERSFCVVAVCLLKFVIGTV